MKGTRHSEGQIIAILKQGEAGLSTAELCRRPPNQQSVSSRLDVSERKADYA